MKSLAKRANFTVLFYSLDPLYVEPIQTQVDMYGDPRTLGMLPRIMLAPDHFLKFNVSGLGTYDIAVPCLAADARFEGEWHNTTFVNYLRISFRWAGLPGLERVAFPPTEDLARLTDGLLPLHHTRRQRGWRFTFQINLTGATWNDQVVEVIGLGQRVAHGWILSGDVRGTLDGWSNDAAVAGITAIQRQLWPSNV